MRCAPGSPFSYIVYHVAFYFDILARKIKIHRKLNIFAPVLVLLLALTVAGCSSTTNSNTSAYLGPSLSTVTAKNKEAKSDLRVVRRKLNRLEKLEARDERRLKRKNLSKSGKAKIEKRIAKRVPQLKQLQRDVKKAQKVFDRSVRSERRAQRRLETAQRRKDTADRRAATAKKRKEELLAAAVVKKKKSKATVSPHLPSPVGCLPNPTRR